MLWEALAAAVAVAMGEWRCLRWGPGYVQNVSKFLGASLDASICVYVPVRLLHVCTLRIRYFKKCWEGELVVASSGPRSMGCGGPVLEGARTWGPVIPAKAHLCS